MVSEALPPDAQAAAWAELLASPDFGVVIDAKNHLVNLQAHALVPLVDLMAREELVQLMYTADTIYPGAEHFYGHGMLVQYDIDWVHIRAGWVFEQLAQESFGFNLSSAFGPFEGFAVMLTGDWSQVPDGLGTLEARKQAGREAAQRARQWVEDNPDWSCLGGVTGALRSEEPERQQRVLEWLAHSYAACDGLTLPYYESELRPWVEILSRSEDAEIAKMQCQVLHLAHPKPALASSQRFRIAEFQGHVLRDS